MRELEFGDFARGVDTVALNVERDEAVGVWSYVAACFSINLLHIYIAIKMNAKDEPFRPVAPEHTVLASRIVIDGTSAVPDFCADLNK